MAINPTIPNVSLPLIDRTDLSALDNRGVDGAATAQDDFSANGSIGGDELMSMNVWPAGPKILVDQRALSSQASSAQDIVNPLIIPR